MALYFLYRFYCCCNHYHYPDHHISVESLDKVYELDPVTNSWTEVSAMMTARRDHACLFIQLEDSSGVLVTGGLGKDDEVLASAEFYDVETRQWQQVSGLKLARTEHSMSLVSGLPTVIGGVNGRMRNTLKS